MMTLRTGSLLLAVLAPVALPAQSAPDLPIGLGIGMVGGADIRVPIRLSAGWRIEPMVFVSIEKTTFKSTLPGSPSSTATSKYQQYGGAVVLSRRIHVDSDLDWYLGPRFGLVRRSSDTDSGPSGSSNRLSGYDKQVGAVTGAELTLLRRFSIGGEVGAQYHRADLSGDASGPGTSVKEKQNQSGVQTFGSAVVRWYFGHRV